GSGASSSGSGASGSSGSGGSTGTGGATPVDPPGPKDPDTALRAGIFIGSCASDDGVSRILNYIYTRPGGIEFWEKYRQITGCFTNKTNGCEAVEQCAGYGFDPAGACNPGCTGDTFQECSTANLWFDCTKVGMVCDPMEVCVSAPPPPLCDAATYV